MVTISQSQFDLKLLLKCASTLTLPKRFLHDIFHYTLLRFNNHHKVFLHAQPILHRLMTNDIT